MPALPLLVVLLVPLLAGCVPGGARSDGVPTADAPFTLTALDVGQTTFPCSAVCEGPSTVLHEATGLGKFILYDINRTKIDSHIGPRTTLEEKLTC
jgi:hypothetical protein